MSIIYYDEPISEYHAAPYLSASKLNDYAKHGPRWFAARHVTGKSAREPASDAQVFGQAFEDMIQQPRSFESLYAIRPEGMKFTTKEGKAWRDAQTKPVLDVDEVVAMGGMRESLHENETAMQLIAACRMQATVRAPYPGTPGIQARPDWFSATGCAASGFRPFTLDLKTTIGLNKLTSGRGIIEYRYHSQAAIAGAALSANGHTDCAAYILAVEKTPSYRCQVIEIPSDWLSAGWAWAEKQLKSLAVHYERNDWPRADAEMVSLPPVPKWVVEQDEESEAA